MALADSWEAFIRIHGGEVGARDMFENAMAELLRAENPGKDIHTVKAAQGDGGIDVYVQQEAGIDVYQCKFFMGTMNPSRWSQVKDSFNRIMEFMKSDKAKGVKLLRWFLCMPREMQKEDITRWIQFCKEREDYEINMKFVDGKEIIERMRNCDRYNNTDFISRYFTVPNFSAGGSSSQEDLNLPPIRAKVPASCRYFITGHQRTKDLINIHNMLQSSGHALWIYGDGGIGKTELMLRFAEIHPVFEYIFIQYKGSIDQTLSQNLFYLPGYEKKGIELSDIVRYQQNLSVITQYCDQLKRANRRLLIIIDNYDCNNYEKTFREMTEINIDNAFSGEENDLKAIQALLRTGAQIVLTTRTTPDYNPSYLTYELKVMEQSDLIDVILGCFPRIVTFLENPEVREKLGKIIRVAESNTVFVAIMASAMQSSNLGPLEALDSMLESLKSNHAYYTDYSGKTSNLRNHMESVLNFMGLSFQNKYFLGVLTMIPNEGIDSYLLQKITETGAVQLDRDRQIFIEKLVNNHILVREKYPDPEDTNKATTVIRMHPLVSDHAQWVLIGDNKKAFYNLIYQSWIIKLLYYFDDDKIKNISYQDNDYNYLLQIADLCSSTESRLQVLRDYFGEQYEEKIISRQRSLLEKAVALSSKVGNFKDAVEYAERLINIEGPSSADLDSIMYLSNNLAVAFFDGGKYSLAIHYLLITLSLLNDRNEIYVADSCDIDAYDINEIIEYDDAYIYGSVFNNLASVYRAQGEYDKAPEYYEKALVIREKVLGKDHPSTATTYNNIASVYEDQGEYDKALEYYEKALVIREKVLGKDHPFTATTYNNIASVYENQGEYDKALEYYEKDLVISEKVLGKDHPDTATTFNNIAGVYRVQGDYNKALEYNEKSREIQEKVLGNDHPSTAITYGNLAGVYSDQGEYDKSLEYYEKALKIQEKVLGNNHPDMAATYNNMALVYRAQGNYEKSLEYYEKSREIQEKVIGKKHPDTAITYNNMAGVYHAKGEYDKALEYYEKALKVFTAKLGEEHPYTKAVRKNIEFLKNSSH